jgi:alpha-beta hydrolase superfamily lysophospholipase
MRNPRANVPRLLAAGLTIVTAACSQMQPAGPPMQEAKLFDDYVLAPDGFHLPLRHWRPDGEPAAVALGVHGFNDYSRAFDALSATLTAQGFALYAYDQRGFGNTEPKGVWPGQATLVADLKTVIELLRERYPDKPMYVIGESMGGAVVTLALTGKEPPAVDGAVLLAPAVWGREVMPWYQRVGLSLARFFAPAMTFSGKTAQRFGVRATDDAEFARALRADPLVLKRARVDTLDGLSDLMSAALRAAPRIGIPTLLLYGASDEVIPPPAMCALLDRVPPGAAPWRMVLYPKGFHLLTRYTGAATTYADVAAWLHDRAAPLPSGDEVTAIAAQRRLCGKTVRPPTKQAAA